MKPRKPRAKRMSKKQLKREFSETKAARERIAKARSQAANRRRRDD